MNKMYCILLCETLAVRKTEDNKANCSNRKFFLLLVNKTMLYVISEKQNGTDANAFRIPCKLTLERKYQSDE